MLYGGVCIAGVLFSVLASVIWFGRKNAVESAVMGIILWLFTHIIVSMGLFVVDRYGVKPTAWLTAFTDLILLAAAVFVRRGRPFKLKKLIKADFSVKDMVIPLLVCLLTLPFVHSKNEMFGMGQDHGVYQTQAVLFMNGDTRRQKDFSEYHDLESDAERENFEYNVKNHLRGFDIEPENYPKTSYRSGESPVSGIFHGIPTYSALLAMWGTLFGMENMMGIETLFYFLLIFLVYFICREFKLKASSSFCACAAAAMAPVVIWVAKSALTEMFLALLPAAFLYLIADEDNPDSRWLSIIPVAVFSCYHVSIYTMVPLFVMVYGYMYVVTREKQFAVLMPVTICGYFISYFMMRHVQPFYTMNNYSPLFVGGIDPFSITKVVIAVSAAGLVVVAAFIAVVSRIVKKKKKSGVKKVTRRRLNVSKSKTLAIRLMLILPALYIAVKALTKYNGWGGAKYLTLVGFGANIGIVLFVLGFISALIWTSHIAASEQRVIAAMMFFYCILFYSAFLRYDIQYYYYYSRYLAPFVPIGIILCVMTLDRFGGKLLYPATAAGIAFSMPYNTYLMGNKDDTRMEWSVINDLSYFIDDSDCVVISSNYTNALWLPIRSINHAAVYPENESDPDQLRKLTERHGKVYYISEKTLNENDFKPLYKNVVHHSEDDLNNEADILPYPEKFWKIDDNIGLYVFDKYDFDYTAIDDMTKMTGVSALEGTYCWTNSETPTISCGLYPTDYNVILNLGNNIPLGTIGCDEIEVKMYLNGKEFGEQKITQTETIVPLNFELPAEYVREGENTLEIRTPLWKASKINPNDTRELGIPIQSVQFRAAD